MRPIVGGDANEGGSNPDIGVLGDAQGDQSTPPDTVRPDVQGDQGPIDVQDAGAVDTGDVPRVDVVPTDSCVPSIEICNSRDDNCNGLTDEGLGTETCGTGACARTVNRCVNGAMQTCTPLTPPETVETSCDNIDNDCDGMTDEDLGDIQCGTGACMQSLRRCQNGAMQTCPTTMGTGTNELCNNLDDDCDGMTDELYPTKGNPCNNLRLGECRLDGMFICNPSNPSAVICSVAVSIMPPPSPQAESCNLRDDNCDGQTDEVDALGRCSLVGNGRCQVGGNPTCQNGVLGLCPTMGDSTRAQSETCNMMDDDCNGATDDMGNCPLVGNGRCQVGGQARCTSGVAQTCPVTGDATRIQTETCNLMDDNCDGLTDNIAMLPCATGMSGICATGTSTCLSGNPFCQPNMVAMPETCNGNDDNCNGVIDDNLTGNPCTTAFPGVCAAGTTNCRGALGSVCNATVTPGTRTETCNGMDDNCNGQVDEGVSTPCYTGAASTRNVGICRDGAIGCVGSTCAGQVLPGTEACNLMDDNCNGATDEANPATMCPPTANVVTTACNSGLCQVAANGCASGFVDLNGALPDGCECADTGAPNTCTNARSVTYPSTNTGTIPFAMGNSDFYTVSFPPDENPPMRGSGTIDIRLATGYPEFALEIRSTAGGATCANGPLQTCSGMTGSTASGVQVYTFKDDGTTNPTGSSLPSIGWKSRNVSWPAGVFVRVYRASSTITCNQYQLVVTRSATP